MDAANVPMFSVVNVPPELVEVLAVSPLRFAFADCLVMVTV